MAHGSHDQMEKKIQVSIFFFFKFGLVTQGPKVPAISLKQEGPAVHYYWGTIGNLVSGLGFQNGRKEDIIRQVTFIEVY